MVDVCCLVIAYKMITSQIPLKYVLLMISNVYSTWSVIGLDLFLECFLHLF